jgi:UDPglucose 6-dehydrogenase
MIIGIIGLGFVGSAIYKSFKLKNLETICYDKYKDGGIGNLEDILKCNLIFLCLPTVYSEITNTYDISPINEICNFLNSKNYKGPVIIKSTVEPETTKKLNEKFYLNLIHNPEFLSANTAFEDFHNQKHIVLGKSFKCNDESINTVNEFYKINYPEAIISLCDSTESECMKIFCNNFYAAKIQFFNELYLISEKIGVNYDNVKNLMIKNGWINPMHTLVPGTDGKLSFGGLCFVKDTAALLSFMKLNNSPCKVLESVINERNEMRSDKENIINNKFKN